MIDPRISLAARTLNVGNTFTTALNNVRQAKQNYAQQLVNDQNTALAPLQLQQAQRQNDVAQAQQPSNLQQADNASLVQTVTGMALLSHNLNGASNEVVQQRFTDAANLAQQHNYDPTPFFEAANYAATHTQEEVQKQLVDTTAHAQQFLSGLSGKQSAEQRSFSANIANLSPADQEKARRIKLGLDAPVRLTAAERFANDQNLTNKVSESQSKIDGAKAGARESAKLTAQFKLKPQVAAAVAAAVATAKANIKLASDNAVKNRSNKTALALYETSMSNLEKSLGNTSTGFFSGLSPAFTSNQQVAEGAIALMAPMLKQLFRTAGEGTFSDADQKILTNMIPTRRVSKEAAKSIIEGINTLVRAKLSQKDNVKINNNNQPQNKVIKFDAQGNIIQ